MRLSGTLGDVIAHLKVFVDKASWCWQEKWLDVNAELDSAAGLVFTQTGFKLVLNTSHQTDLVFTNNEVWRLYCDFWWI